MALEPLADDTLEIRTRLLEDMETHRTQTAEPEDEANYSINNWISIIQQAAAGAHDAVRAGDLLEEQAAWLTILSAGMGRMEQLRMLIKDVDGFAPEEVDL